MKRKVERGGENDDPEISESQRGSLVYSVYSVQVHELLAGRTTLQEQALIGSDLIKQ